MALSKKELRKVMFAFAQTDPTDKVAHGFIHRLATLQHYTRKNAFETFVTNARIFFTSVQSKTLLLEKTTKSSQDLINAVNAWETTFIEAEIKCNIS